MREARALLILFSKAFFLLDFFESDSQRIGKTIEDRNYVFFAKFFQSDWVSRNLSSGTLPDLSGYDLGGDRDCLHCV